MFGFSHAKENGFMNLRLVIAEELAKIAEEIVAGRPRMTKEEFVSRAREVHGDLYDYSKVDMDNRDEKGRVCITCKKCGNEFWQRPDKHLDGNGCMECYIKESNGIIPGESLEPPPSAIAVPPPPPSAQPSQQKPAQPVAPQKPVQPPQQKPVQPATPQKPVQKPSPQPSQFQKPKPLAQPVVK